jgi:hypothetical protein
MLLSALRDRAQPEVSAQLLSAARRRNGAVNDGRQFRRENLQSVFSDVVKRATEIRSIEIRGGGTGEAVEAELGRALHRLLASIEDAFLVAKADSEDTRV